MGYLSGVEPIQQHKVLIFQCFWISFWVRFYCAQEELLNTYRQVINKLSISRDNQPLLGQKKGEKCAFLSFSEPQNAP